MQADIFEEAMAAVGVFGDVSGEAAISHAEELVLTVVEEEQTGGQTGEPNLNRPDSTFSKRLDAMPLYDPSTPHALPADAPASTGGTARASTGIGAGTGPTALAVGGLMAATGVPRPIKFLVHQYSDRLSRQTSRRLGSCARRCGGVVECIFAAGWKELSLLLLLVPSALAAAGHPDSGRWRLWLLRPLGALIISRLLCVILFALARAPCVLDNAPLRQDTPTVSCPLFVIMSTYLTLSTHY
mmetsp:Transcript_19671/g.49988  ORF Transcript_19671/g.49988 Transcript_19671/m.49988 type:complete len:242 (-) Transcript_19671:923-1648(-)